MIDFDELLDEYKIGDKTFESELVAHLDLYNKPINDCFKEHPELFAWYATAYELALSHESRLKEELARLYARADFNTRSAAKASAVKLTEKMVENTVITSQEYIELQDIYLEAKRNTGLLKAARDAMIHRRDMLIQLGATYRAEGNSHIELKSTIAKDNL